MLAFCHDSLSQDVEAPPTTETNTSLHPFDLTVGDSIEQPPDSSTVEAPLIHHPIAVCDDANSSIDIVSQEHCDHVSLEQQVDTSCTVQPLEILRLMELPSMAYPPPQRCFFRIVFWFKCPSYNTSVTFWSFLLTTHGYHL